MQRMDLPVRPDWKSIAEKAGFTFHTMYGEPYWDETSAYAFSLDEIETRIEDPSTELHAMCREAADAIIRSDELMERLAIPEEHRDFVAASWRAEEPELYGRFDLVYDGAGPASLLEYNADTPTSLYESAAFQWQWLEDQIAAGVLQEGDDQFNRIHEALSERFAELFAPGAQVHCAAFPDQPEDYATAEAMGWAAKDGGLVAEFTAIDAIGVTADGQFTDSEDRVIGALFKLYPWEDILRDDFALHLAGSGVRFLEPAWKAVVSNKGLLPVLWRMFEGHPNLLPAFFADELETGSAAVDRARIRLEAGRVEKPLFSREGASITITEGGRVTDRAEDRSYDAHPMIVQALRPLPSFEGFHPIVGAWVVGQTCVGMGIREDRARITQNLSRFKPHFIRD